VARSDLLAEERDWPAALMENSAEARARRITLDDEVAVERRKL